MDELSSRETDVLIVGAGPTGLVLALWLTRLGVRVRIIDKAPQPSTTSRAVAVQARTLEFYRQIGLADAVVEQGRPALAVTMWVAGRRVAHAAFADMGAGVSPYPYALLFAQDEHERLLTDRLRAAGVEVERGTALVNFEETGGRVRARLQRSDGGDSACEVAFVAGCDGAHSAVRETVGTGFAGGTYAHLFYVADVQADGPAMNGDVHVAFDRSDFLAVFPLKGDGRARLVGTIREDAERRRDDVSWSDVGKRVIEWMRIDVTRVNWFSTYRVHHRVADHFRSGRAFLLGDAAHIHSPVGGQGMNTGIGDAVNLAWKLAAVLHRDTDSAILDTYETERIAFARRLVATTDQAFVAVTSASALARALRLHIVPFLFPSLFSFKAARRFVFRTVTQTAVNYRGSMLSEGRAGRVQGGDRLPWVKVSGAGGTDADNFAALTSLAWQVHVYGSVTAEVRSACAQRRLPLHVFEWNPSMRRSGLESNGLYLVRPDGYVALANRTGDATALNSYLDGRGGTALHPHGLHDEIHR